MFKKEPKQIDKAMDQIYTELDMVDPSSEEYTTAVKNLETLSRIKSGSKINKDTLIGAGANLIGIFAVLNFERIGVVTSKAFGMIRHIRI